MCSWRRPFRAQEVTNRDSATNGIASVVDASWQAGNRSAMLAGAQACRLRPRVVTIRHVTWHVVSSTSFDIWFAHSIHDRTEHALVVTTQTNRSIPDRATLARLQGAWVVTS